MARAICLIGHSHERHDTAEDGMSEPMDLDAIRAEARRQLAKERFEEAVRVEVERLKSRRPWWHAVFPFEINVRRRK